MQVRATEKKEMTGGAFALSSFCAYVRRWAGGLIKPGLLAVSGLCLCACSLPRMGVVTGAGGGEYISLFQPEPVEISYEVPVLKPHGLVDRLGYEPDRKKTVVFVGRDLPEEFQVCDQETGAEVLRGRLSSRSRMPDHDGMAVAYGDITELDTEGQYYLRLDKYGQSYPFLVHGDLFYTMYLGALEQTLPESGEAVEATELYRLLLAWELYPEATEAAQDDQTPPLPEICRQLVVRLMEAEPSEGEAYSWCAALAKYSLLASERDPDGGARALDLAGKKYETLVETPGKVSSTGLVTGSAAAGMLAAGPQGLATAEGALAAIELYRAGYGGGDRELLNYAGERLKGLLDRRSDFGPTDLLAMVSYLNTVGDVDRSLCEDLMGRLMGAAETMVAEAGRSPFLVRRDEPGELIEDIQLLCVVNHIIANYEYRNVIEDYFHYIMGRNPDSTSLVSYWEGQRLEGEDLLSRGEDRGRLIFMLASLL